jgi:hypothetical protein
MLELKNLTIVEEKWLEPCTLNQLQTAERLEISERYLRELDEFCPPRTQRGSGVESKYIWPATLFWFLEFQIAQARRRRDSWAFEQWLDKQSCMSQLVDVRQRLDDLLAAAKEAGTKRGQAKLIQVARRIEGESKKQNEDDERVDASVKTFKGRKFNGQR